MTLTKIFIKEQKLKYVFMIITQCIVVGVVLSITKRISLIDKITFL